VLADIQAVFADAGADVQFHVRSLDTGAEVGGDADAGVVLASVFKIPVIVELARQVDSGGREWTERVRVPAHRRTTGPTGISVMLDDVDVSLRDLTFLMMSVSDNTATDVIMELLGGVEPINATMCELGLEHTRLLGDCDHLLTDLGQRLDLADRGGSWQDIDPETMRSCEALHAPGTNASTPREMTTLLGLIWGDEAASPAACAEIRRILALQVWPHRITSGFPDGVAIAAKTGTLPGLRNEAGVVEYPDGSRYAVAIFTRAHTFEYRLPAIDAAIGTAARLAIESLRT
jgi:beta-lactamase class A